MGSEPVQLQRDEHCERESEECNWRSVAQGHRVGHAETAEGPRETQIQTLIASSLSSMISIIFIFVYNYYLIISL